MGAPASMEQCAREVAPIFRAIGERVLAEQAAARKAARAAGTARPASPEGSDQ